MGALPLSAYIVSFATSAVMAQKIMSQGNDPMTIAEFKFKINISAEYNVETTTEAQMSIWRTNMNIATTLSSTKSFGVEIECTIKPSFLVTAEAQGGSSSSKE